MWGKANKLEISYFFLWSIMVRLWHRTQFFQQAMFAVGQNWCRWPIRIIFAESDFVSEKYGMPTFVLYVFNFYHLTTVHFFCSKMGLEISLTRMASLSPWSKLLVCMSLSLRRLQLIVNTWKMWPPVNLHPLAQRI